VLTPERTQLRQLANGPVAHLMVAGLVCLFVVSPALFTPWGFGPDYTNHLWLVWQQGLAISHAGHPSLYLQSAKGIFEPFYAFYGGTLYAATGAVSALFGNHAYPIYIVSIAVSVTIAYGGTWWLSRQLGLSRWVAHLPAFVVVTAAYYLTDLYARGAWPEFVALSAVPLVIAAAARLLLHPWRAGPVALFLVGAVILTGSHNITLLWSVILLGLVGVAVWICVGRSRPPLRSLVNLLALGVLAAGVNAWFLVIDLGHASDTLAWAQNLNYVAGFEQYFYFDNLGVVLDPLRQTPVQSTTYGLTIAAPVAAFCASLIFSALAWPEVRRRSNQFRTLWLVLLGAMVLIVALMVMPASWWAALGTPFTDIQFPYRLAGWLLLAIAVQMAFSLRFARGLTGARRQVAFIVAFTLIALTVVQAAAQMYSGPRVDGETNSDWHPRTLAFESGATTPPPSYYGSDIYGDTTLPLIEKAPQFGLTLPVPEPGQTEASEKFEFPAGSGPFGTNVIGGPYVVRIEGMRVVGRTSAGFTMVEANSPHTTRARLTAAADAGGLETVGAVISIVCLLGCLALVLLLAIRRPPAALVSRLSAWRARS
jgi:hypothetical protein